ncbi:MAG: 3-hydroxyacyl-CoA dehydrogenase NAD-binding domain-containing protein [Nevskia sp.]|nr:3-hydroxyacyl-CoA dehydrogenase NAD-binding domain-containing protein [Nevskia sp.]
MHSTFQVEIGQDRIAVLKINLADRTMNVLTPAFERELAETVERLAADASVKGLVLTSGKQAFIAGADLKALVELFERETTPRQAAAMSQSTSRLFRRIETCGKPVAAAINGLALGGGFELCLACHYRVLADDPRAVVGLPEVKVGLLPGAGGTQRVPRLAGIARGLPLLLEGRHLKPQEALQLGLVHELAPQEQVVERARAWIAQGGKAQQPWDAKDYKVPGGAGISDPVIATLFTATTAAVQKSTQRNYPAPLAILSAVFEGTQVPIDTGLRIESKYFGQLATGAAARNLIRAMFINKTAADSLARRPAGFAASKVGRLGMLGAGMMGAGIAYSAAAAGIEVVLLDTSEALAKKGKDYTRGLVAKGIESGRLDTAAGKAIEERIRTTCRFEDLAGCELVIEAVFENRALKAEVTRKAEAVIPASAVFASNTSTLPITGLAEASVRPAQFIGLHFFSPVDRMPLVEVILGRATAPATVAKALDFVRQIRKTPIVVNDSRGFYTSRVFGMFNHEGMRMLAEGVDPALIENVSRAAGMPVGPLAVSDEVSLELIEKVMAQSEADLGGRYVKPAGYDVVRRFVHELKRPGRKAGQGFYDYPQGGRKQLWPGLREIYPPAATQPAPEEIRKRILYIQAIETVRCLEEDVLTHPADADLGAILGWGFPAWTGGPLSLIETVGLQSFVADCERFAKAYGSRYAPTEDLRRRAHSGTGYYAAAEASPSTGGQSKAASSAAA